MQALSKVLPQTELYTDGATGRVLTNGLKQKRKWKGKCGN